MPESLNLFVLISFGLAVAALGFTIFTIWLSWELYKQSREQNDSVKDSVARIDASVTGIKQDITEIVQRAVAYWTQASGGPLEEETQTATLEEFTAAIDEIRSKIAAIEAAGGPNISDEIKKLTQAQHSQTERWLASPREARTHAIFPGIEVVRPAVNVSQDIIHRDEEEERGRLSIIIIRRVPAATGTGRFSPPFSTKPHMQINLVSSPPAVEGSTLVRVGVGTNFDFNVHLRIEQGLLALGEYQLEYKATVPQMMEAAQEAQTEQNQS